MSTKFRRRLQCKLEDMYKRDTRDLVCTLFFRESNRSYLIGSYLIRQIYAAPKDAFDEM